jgi:hypothetical protein
MDSVAANGEIQPKTWVNVGMQVTAASTAIHVSLSIPLALA